ncbi:MAG: fatty oxidation complex subunit alpha [Gemmatimonadetes bacterium]|nr:fatty oxidation complex subunit alpha [Gemmatimonadota bacterium]
MGVDESPSQSPRLSVDEEGLARVVFDALGRSVNVLDASVMTRLADLIGRLREGAEAGTLRGVLLSSAKPTSFIVGADIDAIAAVESPDEGAEAARLGQRIYLALERLPVPTLAAIRGTCLGGGTELALACRYRIASDHEATRIGLPEVQLGILPAWGGTTRLPRLLGLQAALGLLLTGEPVGARKARRIGLVDEVFPHAGFEEAAVRFLAAVVREGPVRRGPPRGLAARLVEDTLPGRSALLWAARRQVMERTGGHYPAPLRILDVLGASLGQPLERALELEAATAGELIASPVSKNLAHVFRLREAARKGPVRRGAVPPPEIAAVGVVGAGVMGGGIAQLAAYNGIRARLKDVRHDAVGQALSHASSLLASAVKRGKLSRREADHAMERVSGGLDYVGFGSVGLVIEAVVERMDVKKSVLRELEARVSDSCILATNTSSLSVNAMAADLRLPARFVGIHFFNPVHRMPLVEIVRGRATSDATVTAAYALALRLGKVPIVVRDGAGFLVNRILGPYLNEAGHLLEAGASIEAVDATALGFGMPMGPLRLVDEIGIDVAGHAGRALHEAFGERLAPARPLIALGESGRLGHKGGSGFYKYQRDRSMEVDPEIYPLLGLSRPPPGSGPSREEIRDRLVLSMINEAARALSEGVAASAADVDLGMIMGTGFPPFRGGLLRLADEEHPRTLLDRLRLYQRTVGPRLAPAPALEELARSERGFYEAFPG